MTNIPNAQQAQDQTKPNDKERLLAGLRRAAAECQVRIAEERLRSFEFDEVAGLLNAGIVDVNIAVDWLDDIGCWERLDRVLARTFLSATGAP